MTNRNLPIAAGERNVAMQTIGRIFMLSQSATEITIDQLELAQYLQSLVSQAEIIGPGRDTVEMNNRIIAAFAEWRRELQKLIPTLRILAAQGPMPETTKTSEDI